ncbi:MAG: NUDIX hydrolase [Deltaproteobacteria bacterium]|nr:MAG: NUDIX hydrolase [Deltaproteobacteria bacterium]RUA00190.1 MAG: NUDIX hydrolase [Deltaproteobacteria bacterium]
MTERKPKRFKGCSLLLVNSRNELLLLLRDDTPAIPYPGMWDLPGGHVEPGETPFACIAREMNEEMGFILTGQRLFVRTEFSDRIEFTFWKKADLDIDRVDLTEGQQIAWFSGSDAGQLPLAYGFNPVVNRFFDERPFLSAGL